MTSRFPVLNVTKAMPPSWRPALGQALPKQMPSASDQMTEDQILRQAAAIMITTGDKVIRQLNTTYEKYKGVGNWWLAEAAASFVAGGPAGPALVAADIWWQSSRENEAVAALQAVTRLGNDWIISMSEKWLPAFIEKIDAMDPALGQEVTDKFDEVVRANGRVVNLLSNVKLLPPRIITEAINTFFGSLKKDLEAASAGLLNLLNALGSLLRAAGQATDVLGKLVQAAPMVALLAGVAIVGYLAIK